MIRTGTRSLVLCLATAMLGCWEQQAASVAESTKAATTEPSLPLQPEVESPLADPGNEHRPSAGELTKEALADLESAGAFLASQSRFSFRAVISYEALQQNGQLLEFGGTREITVRRPDRMRFRSSDRTGASKSLYFDGQKISVDLPAHRAYVEVERPGTLYAALDHLVDDLGIPAPLEDLIGEDFAARVRPRIESGYFVGSTVFANRSCAHLAYRTSEVDVQLWIEEGARPLPCRIVITYLRESGRPQFRAQIEDWNLAPEASDATFEYRPPPDAERISVTKAARARARAKERE